MKNINVNEYVEGAIESVGLQRSQIKSAGTIIAQFLLVREGLTDRVPEAELNAIAAALTAGIWANNSEAT